MPPKTSTTKAAARQQIDLSGALAERWPFAKWELVDVTFPTTPDTDLTIPHLLKPSTPGDVHYMVIKQTTAGVVYETDVVGRKPSTTNFLVLRSDVASWHGRLLLGLLADPLIFTP